MPDKTAVITGAGTGIGQAIAIVLAKAGYQTIIAGRRAETLCDTQQRIEQHGALCLVQPTDVGDPQSVDALASAVVERFGRIDVWVNNAGFAAVADIDAISTEDVDALLRTNAAGVVYACRAVWPVMRRGGGGTIVNISSVAASDAFPGLEVYGASKAFVSALSRSLAVAGKPHGIHVFAVAPGAVETQMLRDVAPEIPQSACLEPADIARVVVELTTPTFRHCTGQTITVRQ